MAPCASCISILRDTTVSRPTGRVRPSPCRVSDARLVARKGLHQVEYLGGMAARVDPVGGVADDAFLVDHEGGAHQALAAHTLGFLLLDDAVLAAHLPLRVGEQGDRDALLV